MRLRALSRRSFLIQVTGSAVLGGGALGLVLAGGAQAQPRSRRMIVDSDPNDPARSGLTDSDTGSRADPAGNGRGQPSAAAPPRRAPEQPRPRPADSDPADVGGMGRPGALPPPSRVPPPVVGSSPPSTERFVICPGNRRCPR